jgi:hypothetical protein
MRGPQVLLAIVTLFGYFQSCVFEPTTQDITHRDIVPIWPRPALGDVIGVGAGSDSSPPGLVASPILLDEDLLMRGQITPDRNR